MMVLKRKINPKVPVTEIQVTLGNKTGGQGKCSFIFSSQVGKNTRCFISELHTPFVCTRRTIENMFQIFHMWLFIISKNKMQTLAAATHI